MKAIVLLLVMAPLLGGCVATAVVGAAVAVVKVPFKVAGAGIDMVTTSEEEADRNRGEALREAEEAETKAAKKAEKARKKAAKAALDDG